jgi:hypothetical protein
MNTLKSVRKHEYYGYSMGISEDLETKKRDPHEIFLGLKHPEISNWESTGGGLKVE